MVSTPAIIFSVITLMLSLILPIVLAVWFCRKYQVSAVTVLLGAATFLIFQLILRIPLMQIFNPILFGRDPINGSIRLVLYGLYLAFTAALFEEGGRALAYKLFLKKKGDWKNAVAFGIGHGGFEAVILVGVTYIGNLIFIAMINFGIINTSGGMDDAVSQAVKVLTETQPVLFLLAGIERVFAMALHIGFSLLVFYGLSNRKYQFLFYAFLAHFILNFPLTFLSGLSGGAYAAIVYIGVMAALALYWTIKISPKMFLGIQEAELKESGD